MFWILKMPVYPWDLCSQPTAPGLASHAAWQIEKRLIMDNSI